MFSLQPVIFQERIRPAHSVPRTHFRAFPGLVLQDPCSLSLRAALTHLVAESSPALEGDANATFDTVLCLLLRLLALPLCSRHHHGVQCSSLQTTLAVDVSSSSSSSSSSRRASLSLRTGLPGPSTVGSLTSGQGLLEDGVRTMISSCAFS
ncbi:hypothetical protein H920_04678 [Fukomys damarensis]|uniref:Uncharacterized protein n=1 Tax=Fukomys damarensis TaxID=885580 RepID=A0A091DTV0_FUKDA|nr:hypothetical protein H920_04678 [Fukomys damarensis]